MVFIDLSLLLLGFIFLLKGADLLVDGAGSLAKRFGFSEIVIGLTVVSFGTSAPELVVNMLSSATGNTELALGNIIGSNIANTLLVLGVAAVIFPLAVRRNTVRTEIPLALLASFAVLFLANDVLIDKAVVSSVTRVDGLVLLLLFSIFLYYTYGISKQREGPDNPDIKRRSWKYSIWLTTLGILGLTAGAKWIVTSAESLAVGLGISQAVIGLSILALGTSVPELATSAVAAWRHSSDIAIGNIVGSNIFNLLFVLAITSIINPLPLTSGLNIDMLVMIGASLLLFFVVFNGVRQKVGRREGGVFLAAYVMYILTLMFR